MFFGSLIPLVLRSGWVFTPVLLCGLGSAAPMAGLALLMIFSARSASRLASGICRFQPWFLKITGVTLLIAGLYLTEYDTLGWIA